jgi:hypothetical protein
MLLCPRLRASARGALTPARTTLIDADSDTDSRQGRSGRADRCGPRRCCQHPVGPLWHPAGNAGALPAPPRSGAGPSPLDGAGVRRGCRQTAGRQLAGLILHRRPRTTSSFPLQRGMAYAVSPGETGRRWAAPGQAGAVGRGGRAGSCGTRFHGLCLAYFFQRAGLSSSGGEAHILPHVSQARRHHGARDPRVEPTSRLAHGPSDHPAAWCRIGHSG